MSATKKRCDYEEITLKNALSAIRGGMAVSTASKTFGIPRTTLRHKIAGRAPENIGKTGPECVLGADVESKISEWLKQCARMGFPINKDGLFYSISRIVGESGKETPFKNNIPGKKWYANFMKRNPELSYKQSEYLNKARASVTEEKIRRWFEETLNLLGEDAETLEDPSRVWNMDETAFYLNPSGGCVIAEKGKAVYGTSSNSDKENVTTLVTVNALGEFAPPLTLYKFERIPASYVKGLPTKEWGIGKSKNGWMTAETFLQYFENVFHPYLVKKGSKFPVIVFLDGHTSHLSLQLSRFCRQNRIIVVCLFPNATHILQPLDVSVFFPLKMRWRKEVSMWKIKNNGREITKRDVPTLLHRILTSHSFLPAIVNGFRVCGLYPFNADNVDYSKCTQISKNTTIDSQNDIDKNKILEHLHYLESKIDPQVLNNFQICKFLNSKPENSESLLFEVWLQIVSDSEGNREGNDNLENDVIEFPFPEYNDLMNSTEEEDNMIESMKNENDELLNIQTIELQQTIQTDTNGLGNETIYESSNQQIKENNIESTYDESAITNQPTAFVNKETTFLTNEPNEGTDFHSKITQDQIANTHKQKEFEGTICNQTTSTITEPEEDTTFDFKVIEGQTATTHEPVESERICMLKVQQNEQSTIENTKSNEDNLTDSNKENKDILAGPSKINILSNILIVPKSAPTTPSARKKRDPLVSVLTHDMWIQQQEEKERKAIDIQQQKDERKRKREEKKIEQQKSKKVPKRKQVKEQEGNETESPEQQKSKSVQKKEQNNQEDNGKERHEPEDNEMKKPLNEELVKLRKFNVDTYVIVKYEEAFYPGKILKKERKMFLISTMVKSGSDWKWPSREDKLLYEEDAIQEVIETPSKKNNRGIYAIPEMEKFLEFSA